MRKYIVAIVIALSAGGARAHCYANWSDFAGYQQCVDHEGDRRQNEITDLESKLSSVENRLDDLEQKEARR